MSNPIVMHGAITLGKSSVEIPTDVLLNLPVLADAMRDNYVAWKGSCNSPIPLNYIVYFEDLGKFIRIVHQSHGSGSCSGFVAKCDVTTKEGSCKAGDLLKSAGWKKPALNFSRGSIYDLPKAIADGHVRWTGLA